MGKGGITESGDKWGVSEEEEGVRGKIGECWEDRWVGWRLVAGGDQVSPIRSPPCTK